MTENTYTVRLDSGTVGQLKARLKPKEMIGRVAMIEASIDGQTEYFTGVVEHVFEHLELNV